VEDTVALIADTDVRYALDAPFQPGDEYPELRSLGLKSGGTNTTYAAVRELFAVLGMDAQRLGTSAWNPLSDIIRAGDTIMVKPNLVLHEMPVVEGSNCVVTNASVLRPLLDYCVLAGGSSCKIVIGDVPLQSADFQRIVHDNGLQALVEYFRDERGVDIELIDMRPMRQTSPGDDFFFEETISQEGDPRGYTMVDLGSKSWLEPLCESGQPRFAVSDYDIGSTVDHHSKGVHQYYVCNSMLEADVFINVPKLKTHEKAGITVNLKNLVGINGDKSWLPHFRKGSCQSGGDEWHRRSWRKSLHGHVRRRLQGRSRLMWTLTRAVWHRMRPPKVKEDTVAGAADFFEMGGAWYGNDTVWRMVLDLNAIIHFFSAEKKWSRRRCRRYFFLVDGIVAGEGHGPLVPRPKHVGCLLAGFDPVAGDLVAASIMGFDWQKIPLLRHALERGPFALTRYSEADDIKVATRDGVIPLRDLPVTHRFAAPPGWRGMMELDRAFTDSQ
jgi:uncharacterized protein (DUF362 family)